MKKVAFSVSVVLMAIMILAAGCAAKAPPATASTTNVTGELTYLSVPLEGGNVTLTINTPQGVQTIAVADNTTYTLNGKACTLDELGKVLEQGNTTYNCTAVVDNCAPEGFVAKFLSVFTIEK